MKRKSRGNAGRPESSGTLSGGNADAPKESATTADVPHHPRNSLWTILCPSPEGVKVPKEMWWRPAKNATTPKNIFFLWNGSNI